MVASVNGNIMEWDAFKSVGFSTVREKTKGINEILMRKSACSNFTGNDYFLDSTALNSFVFGGMHLQGVHEGIEWCIIGHSYDCPGEETWFNVQKIVCLHERLEPDHPLSAKERGRDLGPALSIGC